MLDNPKQFLNSLPNKAGVYQMYDGKGELLYVGKAKNLKKRVASYFRAATDSKTALFMAQVANIEIIITPNENAALLLESNLIKDKRPRYNVLFKDDKSFPYLLLSKHKFPRLEVYRGVVDKSRGKYFGPFPDASAVNFIRDLLQKVFQLRVCKDSFMRNRTRPCMLHQIKLCKAPCVGYIDQKSYSLQIEMIEQFLNNKNDLLLKTLTELMDEAADTLDYEQAATYRDQITSVRKILSQQAMTKASGNYDLIALVVLDNNVGINILFVRNGLVMGNKNYFPKCHDTLGSIEEILSAFIMHYYLQNKMNIAVVPDKIFLNLRLSDRLKIADVFREKFRRKVLISDAPRGIYRQLITMAEANASNALKSQYRSIKNYTENLETFREFFDLAKTPQRIECFDVSHSMGEAETVSCVVFDDNGTAKSKYRRFNVKTDSLGDDYGALREALTRRYRNLENLPDVLIIDGGKGQIGVASEVLQSLNIKNVKLLAIAKGEGRKPGLEVIYIRGRKEPVALSPESPALHLMQQIRDEAHRFAITGHREKMLKKRGQSGLEKIPGIGKEKRVLLIKHFGGIDELKSAGIDDLIGVKGIGKSLAKQIYEYLHA